MGNFKTTSSQACALLVGVGRELQLSGDATTREVALFNSHVDGQVTSAPKHIDAQGHRVVGRGLGCGRGTAGQNHGRQYS